MLIHNRVHDFGVTQQHSGHEADACGEIYTVNFISCLVLMIDDWTDDTRHTTD